MELKLISNNDIGVDALGNTQNFTFVNEIEINSSWEDMTDTAFIKMPQKLKSKNDAAQSITAPAAAPAFSPGTGTAVATTTAPLFKRNQKVTLRLGYSVLDSAQNKYVNYINTCFEGYLKRIYPRRPLEFECEDQMMQMKLTTVTGFVSKGISTLDVIMAKIITPAIQAKYGFKLSIEAIQVVDLSFKGGITIGEILSYFKKLFNLAIYFQNNILYMGFPYKLGRTQVSNPKGPFDFNTNIISDKLDYMRKDDVLVQVTVININKDNSKTTYGPFGTAGGDNINVYTFDKAASFCADFGAQWVEKYQYEGFRGSFTTFLLPQVKHGDAVKITDVNIPDRNGIYLVKRVITRFGMGGGRQEIFLHKRLL